MALRALVASACIAILAVAAVFLSDKYFAYRADREAASMREIAAGMRESCLRDLDAVSNVNFTISRPKIRKCLFMGALSDKEVSEKEILYGFELH